MKCPQDRPFTRAAGVLKKDSGRDLDSGPRPTTGMVTFAGDILVYKANSMYFS